MESLVVSAPAPQEGVSIVESIVDNPLVTGTHLAAALWLYVDDLGRSHALSQGVEDSTGSYWHGIMHRREGDFSNSHYWFNKVAAHPAIDLINDYDPHGFIDEVERCHQSQPQDLVARQRREWQTLFEWCAREEDH